MVTSCGGERCHESRPLPITVFLVWRLRRARQVCRECDGDEDRGEAVDEFLFCCCWMAVGDLWAVLVRTGVCVLILQSKKW
ncbi:hypothetical protein VFPPC_15970 [Pochonia chlamydosporia 170]|uniref:Uncharacterized protein n=1 Tax=Pochonia chlamydosporia 170 TaxID=1380566 RepID=A0A179FK58_METCM|nr:hypothetical protein VFPPC_15970 [Pochonia chlamydosporia 170]OAQ65996.1 hypothetical protein VFPPC_15970 [Pochonia chlamydosporia 170]